MDNLLTLNEWVRFKGLIRALICWYDKLHINNESIWLVYLMEILDPEHCQSSALNAWNIHSDKLLNKLRQNLLVNIKNRRLLTKLRQKMLYLVQVFGIIFGSSSGQIFESCQITDGSFLVLKQKLVFEVTANVTGMLIQKWLNFFLCCVHQRLEIEAKDRFDKIYLIIGILEPYWRLVLSTPLGLSV